MWQMVHQQRTCPVLASCCAHRSSAMAMQTEERTRYPGMHCNMSIMQACGAEGRVLRARMHLRGAPRSRCGRRL